MPIQTVVTIATGIVGALVTAIVFLYKALDDQRKRDQTRIDQLERELTEERRARNESAAENLKWALQLQEKSYEQIDKLTGISEVLQRRALR